MYLLLELIHRMLVICSELLVNKYAEFAGDTIPFSCFFFPPASHSLSINFLDFVQSLLWFCCLTKCFIQHSSVQLLTVQSTDRNKLKGHPISTPQPHVSSSILSSNSFFSLTFLYACVAPVEQNYTFLCAVWKQ